MAKQIVIEHLFKVFGDAPERALDLARQGVAKQDIVAQTAMPKPRAANSDTRPRAKKNTTTGTSWNHGMGCSWLVSERLLASDRCRRPVSSII